MDMNAIQVSKAACRGLDTNLFFPDDGDDGSAARAICATCPVRSACLTAAIEAGEPHGIYGGAGENARRPLRRAWRIGGIAWTAALDEHFDRLDNPTTSTPIRSLGDNANHGRRVTHARGDRCDLCRITPAIGDKWLARIPSRKEVT